MVKKLLFRPENNADSQVDDEDSSILPMEAKKPEEKKRVIKKIKKPQPVVESSSLVNESNDKPRSLTKLRKLKPIALS